MPVPEGAGLALAEYIDQPPGVPDQQDLDDRDREDGQRWNAEDLGVADNGANRAVLRIWEESSTDILRRVCPYTGTQISAAMLFDGSCDIDC